MLGKKLGKKLNSSPKSVPPTTSTDLCEQGSGTRACTGSTSTIGGKPARSFFPNHLMGCIFHNLQLCSSTTTMLALAMIVLAGRRTARARCRALCRGPGCRKALRSSWTSSRTGPSRRGERSALHLFSSMVFVRVIVFHFSPASVSLLLFLCFCLSLLLLCHPLTKLD